MDQLTHQLQERNLVSIYRDEIDNQSIEGYILGLSPELVVLQYVHDFRLDGLRVLRVQDITEVDQSDSCEFQQALMRKEGLEALVPFDVAFSTHNWQQVIGQFSQDHPILIFECEAAEENNFVIGRLLAMDSTTVTVLQFSGAGVWDDDPTTLAFSDITSCQVGSNYLNVYARHLAP